MRRRTNIHFSPTKAHKQHATHAQTSCESYFSLALTVCARVTAPQLRNRNKTLSHSPKTGATHRHNPSQLSCARKHRIRTRWTKKGRRSKNGAGVIITGSHAHLQLSLVMVFFSSRRVSHAPLHKGAEGEKRKRWTMKRSCRLWNTVCPLPAQHPTIRRAVYCNTTLFWENPTPESTQKP
jgi:hypothetical protein